MVGNESVLSSAESRLGLFWFIAKSRSASRLAPMSRPFSGVAEGRGSKTLDEGHVGVWPTLLCLDQSLTNYDYDYFPRRVNWREEQDSSAQSSIGLPLSPHGKYPPSSIV